MLSSKRDMWADISRRGDTAYIEIWPYDWDKMTTVRSNGPLSAYETLSRGAKASARREMKKLAGQA